MIIVFALAIALLTACGKARRTHRIGILSGNDVFAQTVDGFKAKMADLGYVEGKNVVYLAESTNFDPKAEEKILKEFVERRVDLIFVFPTEAARRAKAAASRTGVPVLFANTTVEALDLVESVRAPGGNLTGVRYPGPAIAVKRLEILHELVPGAQRILVPYQRDYATVPSQLAALREAAASMGVTLVEEPAANPPELAEALEARGHAKDVGFEAILIISGPLALSPEGFSVIGKFAAAHKLPVGGALLSAGGYSSLFAAATDQIEVGRQAAPLADKILRGIPAGTIPVASAEVVIEINYAAARDLGLTVPEGLLRQARRIVR